MAAAATSVDFTLKNTGVFVQDTWAINYNLNLMFGVRIDMPDFSTQRLYNPRIEQLYGFNNTKLVDKNLVQPRVGFNYTFDSDRPTQLRGGVGLFGGAAPNVWLAGAYQNTGLNYIEYDERSIPVGAFTPDGNNPYIPVGGPASARQNVDIIAPGTRLPSVWKANLAFDHELPWYGIVASVKCCSPRSRTASTSTVWTYRRRPPSVRMAARSTGTMPDATRRILASIRVSTTASPPVPKCS